MKYILIALMLGMSLTGMLYAGTTNKESQPRQPSKIRICRCNPCKCNPCTGACCKR